MSQWPGTESISILLLVNGDCPMTTIERSRPFDARPKRGRRQWPLGLAVFAMTVANAALWVAIYAICHGLVVLDQRFFGGF
jgi:hypothetical protein